MASTTSGARAWRPSQKPSHATAAPPALRRSYALVATNARPWRIASRPRVNCSSTTSTRRHAHTSLSKHLGDAAAIVPRRSPQPARSPFYLSFYAGSFSISTIIARLRRAQAERRAGRVPCRVLPTHRAASPARARRWPQSGGQRDGAAVHIHLVPIQVERLAIARTWADKGSFNSIKSRSASANPVFCNTPADGENRGRNYLETV